MTLNHARQWVVLTKDDQPLGLADSEADAKGMMKDWNTWRPDRAPHRVRPADVYWTTDQP